MITLRKIAGSVLDTVGLVTPFRKARGCYRLWQSCVLLRQFIKRGDLCFDIGANVGDISDVMLRLGARVVAVEPQSENVSALEARFAGRADIRVVPKAAASNIGTADLMVCQFSDCSSMSAEFIRAVTGSGRLDPAAYKWNEVRTVQTTTIDELVREHGRPAFVKIDVEGLETEVMRGCSQKLQSLSFEFTPERLESTFCCLDMLDRLGAAKFNYTIERNTHFELPKWVGTRELARILSSRTFRIITGPGGDIYARFALAA